MREIDLHLASGRDVATACRAAGVSDATCYNWLRKFSGMGRSQLSELKALEKENQGLKKIVAELERDKLILKERLDFLKPKTWRRPIAFVRRLCMCARNAAPRRVAHAARLALRQPPQGCIHHSDRGSQYCSLDYRKILRQHGFSPSMIGTGNCYDNAMVETVFKTIKAERVWRQS